MKKQLKKLSGLFRRASRAAKKGVRNATRRVRKFFSRGGAPNVTPAGPVPTEAVNAKPRSRRHRKRKGALRRVTNAVRRVGKGIRNTLTRVFSKKTKHRRRTKKSNRQQGSATNTSATNTSAMNPPPTNVPPTNAPSTNTPPTNAPPTNVPAKNGNSSSVPTAAGTPGIPPAPPL